MNKKIIILFVLAAAVAAGIAAFSLSRPRRADTAADQLSSAAKQLEAQGNLPGAKDAYAKLIFDHPNLRTVGDWQKSIESINIRLLFSPAITAKSIEYEIMPGDSLDKIAREHRTTVELLRRSNNLADDRIVPGKKIKVWNAPFTIFVDKSQNTLLLKSDEEIVKTYTVATGANNSTPVGTFRIVEKIVNPPWYKDNRVIPPSSPENILGTRWMGFDKKGYGIHGTRDPKSLGNQVTAGCVRLANPDVEELFSIVPQGTEVTIVD